MPRRVKKVLSYGRKFRNKSGQTVRYVYRNRKKIGFVILLAADVILPDNEEELMMEKKKSRRGGRGESPLSIFVGL